ncbi:Epidermal growth factor receptor substrate 15-like 1 [Bienertia sinuspersici]
MSTSSRSDTDDSIFDAEELFHIEARCREGLELHVRKLDEARLEDKAKIQELEKELNKCHKEIDYLQDQLDGKTADINYLEELVGSFEMKMVDFDLLEKEVISLREELMKSNSECDFLIQELATKETQLQQSRLHIEKLEESIASTSLDYQCEIESMRLDMMSLEKNCFEPKKSEMCQQKVSHELPDYEELVKELKEELRKEKLRAKDEAEDLAQEMAELRYQMTELLEEERKRRACIEQASLHRIAELEAQLQVERRKSVKPIRSICEA